MIQKAPTSQTQFEDLDLWFELAEPMISKELAIQFVASQPASKSCLTSNNG